jgi:Xaa-Pro aminopeptidase
MNTGFAARRAALVQKFGALQLDSLLVTHPADWYYLTGFTGESGALVVTPRGTTLITDGRFVGQAKAETTGVAVVQQ